MRSTINTQQFKFSFILNHRIDVTIASYNDPQDQFGELMPYFRVVYARFEALARYRFIWCVFTVLNG